MSYSINSLKVILGLSVVDSNKLTKEQKVAMLEFIEKGTDAQVQHLALTGEVKYKFTIAEKKQINEKCGNVKISEGIKSALKEWSKDELVQQGMKHGQKAIGHVAKGAQKVSDYVNQHTGGHGTAAAAIAGGAALAGGAAALLARRRAKKKAEMAKAAAKKK